jgi:O-antigen ligase
VATRRLASVSLGPVVLAAAIPILFLHVKYQPGFGLGFGGTTIDAYLSDFAVLAVVVAAIVRGRRDGFAPLRAGRSVWIAMGLFLAWVFVEVAYGRAHDPSYAWRAHGVTAVKFAEYALLAPAVPLLLRRTRDLVLPLWSLTLWSLFATVIGIAQFFGADIFFRGAVGHRQASFLSSADFAALSSATLLVGLVALAVPRLGLGRRLAAIATPAGVVGMIVAGAMASVAGLAAALVALALVLAIRREIEPRRIGAVAAIAAAVVMGAVAIRGSDLDAFGRFLGAKPGSAAEPAAKVQTYAHRTLLAWIGFEIWKDNPVLGVGWQGSGEPSSFEPYLGRAHERFPNEPALAFPSAESRYGVQNVWIQALADLGVIGLLLWVAVFATALWTGCKAAVRLGAGPALLGVTWTALLIWLWTAQGYFAGIPLDALTWLALGLTATRVVPE